MSFLRKHLIEILISIVVSLLAFIGKMYIDQMRQDLEQVKCRSAESVVQIMLQDIELVLIGETLSDLKATSPPVQRLKALGDRFEASLKNCQDEKKILKAIRSLHVGLLHYINHDFEKAIEEFRKLEQDGSLTYQSLTYQLIGSAKYGWANKVSGNQKKKLMEDAIKNLETASDYALSEGGGVNRLKAALQASCRPHIANITTEANKAALECLSKMVKLGFADHNTYYNIAAKHSRLKNYDLAIVNLQKCSDYGGIRIIHQSEIKGDSAFAENILKSQYADHFLKVIEQFPH